MASPLAHVLVTVDHALADHWVATGQSSMTCFQSSTVAFRAHAHALARRNQETIVAAVAAAGEMASDQRVAVTPQAFVFVRQGFVLAFVLLRA